MDGRLTGRPDGIGSHIWLHHTMQIKVGERMHTIEMDIPIPVGASADMREQLLDEAESNMEELASRIENRAPRKIARNQPSQTDKAPSSRSQVSSGQTAANKSPVALTIPATAPNGAASLQSATAAQAPQGPRQLRGAVPSVSQETAVPPTRPNIGASMPSSPGMSIDTSSSLKLPQFIQFIKEALDLTPKQAMELLNVKSLSGLNLREALEELQEIVGQETANMATQTIPANQKSGESNQTRTEAKTQQGTPGGALRVVPTSAAMDDQLEESSAPSAASPRAFPAASNPKNPDIIELTHAVIRDNPPSYGFDEEIDLDSTEINLEEDEEVEYLPELTNQERELGENVLGRLREAHGSSAASEARLKVLHNVTDSQISEERLQQLVQGVWGISTPKKLKNDQVEALISWAKEDDFFSEAEIVLLLMQEE
jgi:hypothetical protein